MTLKVIRTNDPCDEPHIDANGWVIFTPQLNDGTLDRVVLRLSPLDKAKTGGSTYWKATVIDQPTGDEYDVEAAACGLRCFCAARVLTYRPKVRN